MEINEKVLRDIIAKVVEETLCRNSADGFLKEKDPRFVLDNLREIPDFPEPGVLFRDITPLLANGEAFATLIDGLAGHYRGRIDAVAGLESRGFILAAPLAVHLGIGMFTVRKGDKLPGPVVDVDYNLEAACMSAASAS